jgi:cell division transport system ATP-binding protein
MPTIKLENVSKFYRGEHKLEVAVRDVNLTIEQGDFVFLTGSSGAGKSTLLGLMSGQLKPDRGHVFLGDTDMSRVPRRKRHKVALTFGQVWQEPSLVRRQTVEENLELAAMIGSSLRFETHRMTRMRVRKVLGLVGMAGYEKYYPIELSGGECRRIELARAMINSPSILLLDEITANLDDDNIWDMFHLLEAINRKGTTVVMATHASQYVNIMRRRVITLVDGCIFGDVKKGRYGEIV